jgi:hypothetical protein
MLNLSSHRSHNGFSVQLKVQAEVRNFSGSVWAVRDSGTSLWGMAHPITIAENLSYYSGYSY